jgi:hypothetical protein
MPVFGRGFPLRGVWIGRRIPAVSYVASLDVGNCSLTGAASSLPVARTVLGAAGQYTVNGSPVSFPTTLHLLDAAAAYAVTGVAATLRADYVLGATAGAYSVDGLDAVVVQLRPVQNEAIAVGGGGVWTPARRGIQCGSGEYSLAANRPA